MGRRLMQWFGSHGFSSAMELRPRECRLPAGVDSVRTSLDRHGCLDRSNGAQYRNRIVSEREPGDPIWRGNVVYDAASPVVRSSEGILCFACFAAVLFSLCLRLGLSCPAK